MIRFTLVWWSSMALVNKDMWHFCDMVYERTTGRIAWMEEPYNELR